MGKSGGFIEFLALHVIRSICDSKDNSQTKEGLYNVDNSWKLVGGNLQMLGCKESHRRETESIIQ